MIALNKISLIAFWALMMVMPITGESQSRCDFFPMARGYINDYEDVLSDTEESKLTKIITKHNSKTGNEIAVVSIQSITPYSSLYQYSLDLAKCWGVGLQQKNNGIVIVVSNKLRSVQIQTGKGLEGKLTNAEAKTIVDSIMIPSFKSKGYYDGLNNGLKEIIKELN